MSLVGIDEVSAYMGGNSLTANEKELIENIVIPGVQEELEAYLNTKVELVQVRESLRPECDGYVYFTYAPVRKLLAAQWSADIPTPLVVTQFAPTAVVLDPSVNRPLINRTATTATDSAFRYYVGTASSPGVYSGAQASYVVFDYIAGYDGSKDNSLKLAILRVIAREVERQFDRTVGIRAGSMENNTNSDERAKGWTRDELRQFDRLKRRVVL